MVFVLSFSSCGDDDEDSDSSNNASIVGEWTVESVDVDVAVGDVSLVDYFVSLGFTEAQAAAYVTLFTSEYTTIAGSVELFEDGTYETNFDGEDTYTGVWELSSDGSTLTMDEGTEDEMVFDVVTLTDSKLTLEANESESEDLDDDGTDESLAIVMTMTFTR